MFGVLVVVFRSDPIAGAGFSVSQGQVPLIVSSGAVGGLRVRACGTCRPPFRMAGKLSACKAGSSIKRWQHV
jgi:hypothetical protein